MSRPLYLSLRVLAAILGGYACAWGLAAFGTASLHLWLGMEFHDAELLSRMLALLLYLVLMLWAFASPRLARTWGLLMGSATLLLTLAWLIQKAEVS